MAWRTTSKVDYIINTNGMSKLDQLRAAQLAAGAEDGDLEVEVIPDSQEQEVEEESEDEPQTSPRPRRAIQAPKRYTPVKGSTYKPRGRYAVQHIHLSHTGPKKSKAASKPLKYSGPPRPVGRPRKVQLATEAHFCDPTAAVKVDPAAASLGVQLYGQYGQLLSQVQALLPSLHPACICTQPQDLLAELTGLAAHKQQLQHLQGSMQDIMDTIQRMLPQELQQQAQQALAKYSPAAGGQQSHTSPGISSATLEQQQD